MLSMFCFEDSSFCYSSSFPYLSVMPIYTHFPSIRHEAERLEQEARGRLERQKITDQAEAEKARKELLELEAQR